MFQEIKHQHNRITFDDNEALGDLVKRVREGKTHDLRKDGSNEEFKLCVEMAFSQMISKKKWKMNHFSVDVSSLITVADEAFAIVAMENCIEEWIDIVDNGEEAQKKGTLTKYTGTQTNKDGTKKGWSLEGKKRFNEVYDLINAVRKTKRSEEMEKWARDEWSLEVDTDNLGNRNGGERNTVDEEEARRVREEEMFVPRSGFD